MEYLTKKEKLSRVLIRERKRRDLSQQEVANAVATSLRNYQRWESGETFPHPYSLQKLQGFFGECLNEVTVFDVQEHPLQDRLLAGDQEDPDEVPPQERQDYPSSSETFSETDEGQAETANNRPRMSPASKRRIKHNLILFSTILLILILVVVGIGFLGALLTQLAQALGARVIAISRSEFALNIARKMGASHTLVLDEHSRVLTEVENLTNHGLCDVVIECTGKQRPLDLAAELTRERGRLVVAGYHQDGLRQIPWDK